MIKTISLTPINAESVPANHKTCLTAMDLLEGVNVHAFVRW